MRLDVTEEQFKETVIQLAILHRWQVAHFRPALTKKGWRTPMEGHKGYPDLSLARDGRVLIVELKSMTGKRSREQEKWALEIGDTVYRLWRPSDMEEIKETLR